MKESKSQLAVLGLVVVVLVATFLAGYFKAPHLGLDLQGGLEVVLEAQPKAGQEVTPQNLTDAVDAINRRVNGLGVSEAEVRTQGSDQIAISLPGVDDPDRAVKAVGTTAQLFFYDFQPNLIGNRAFRNSHDLLDSQKDLAASQRKAKKQPSGFFLYDKDEKELVGFTTTKEELLADFGGKVPKGGKILEVPAGHIVVRSLRPEQIPVTTAETGSFDRTKGVYFMLKDDVAMRGQEIETATGGTSGSGGGFATQIQCSNKGIDQFSAVSKDIAQRGALRGTPQHFAIVLDDEAISVPQIDYKQYPNGIQGSCGEISGAESFEEANDLANFLKAGALPVKFEVVSKRQVSATLGKESLQQALYAGGVGLLIVMVYLILFYRFLGLVADIALMIFAFIMYGFIVSFPVVMTLPGIAGMILTIGVAADANIIIFERIREEYRAGRSVRASIKAGYSKGLHGIFDANAVTLITAIVLWVIATGGVRGFAFLLGVGVVFSMFTAVAVTFALLGLLGRLPVLRHPKVMGLSHKEMRFHFKWMNYRNAMLAFAVGVIVVSIGLVGFKGLNLGIDFKSGTEIDVAFAEDVSEDELRDSLGRVDPSYSNATIQSVSAPAGAPREGESSYVVEFGKLAGGNEKAQADLEAALDKDFGIVGGTGEDRAFNVQTIGPTFGKQIINLSLIAIIVSIVLLGIYIWARFDGLFTIPVLAALMHDMSLAVGAYAITGREFNSATVAALLTILGYSLYDTVIVFDRVRENVRLLRKSSFARIVDTSLNEVLTRSLNTTFVVLMPVSAIFFFGGETLKDFAYALLIGVFAGAYSSLVVASPLLTLIKEREPTWKRRRSGASGALEPVTGDNASVEPKDERPDSETDPAAGEPSVVASDSTTRTNGVVRRGDEPESDVAPVAPTRRSDKRPRSKRKPPRKRS